MIAQAVRNVAARWGLADVKLSPRERAMAAAFLATIAAYAAVSAFDWSVRVRDEAAQAATDLAIAEQERAQLASGVTQELVDRQMQRLRSFAFTAQTLSIARVAAQSRLEQLATEAGILNVRVTPDSEIVGEGDVRAQTFTLQGSFDWTSFLVLITSLASSPESLTVLGVSVDHSTAPSFRLVVQALVAESSEV
jgi:hypothetical protein